MDLLLVIRASLPPPRFFFFGKMASQLCSYRAKILANIIITDPNLRTYADIGFKAFGRKSVVLTGLLFSLELFAVRYAVPSETDLPPVAEHLKA